MMERPILFSAEMVRAILDGRKTQTRRVIPEKLQLCKSPEDEPEDFVRWCRYGKPGDLLWVRETWIPNYYSDNKPAYRADLEYTYRDMTEGIKWHPSIFMPRWASRITLKITKVRVEKLQEITYEDAIAEGTPGVGLVLGNTAMLITGTNNMDDCEKKMRIDSFAELWDFINVKNGYPWSSNPWVWVIDFESCHELKGEK